MKLEKRFNPAKLMEGAEPAVKFDKITREIIKEYNRKLTEGYSRYDSRSLMHQVVGAVFLEINI